MLYVKYINWTKLAIFRNEFEGVMMCAYESLHKASEYDDSEYVGIYSNVKASENP